MRRVYDTREWRRRSKACLQRDGYWCQIRLPGCTGRATVADHIVEMQQGGDRLPPLEGLQAACRHCNTAKKNIVQARRARAYGRQVRAI
jgi:5-methylcytosine-specific restriction endonuclease McrA